MSQTSVIFFGLLVGFVVFITIKGELTYYLGVLGLGNTPLTAASCGAASGGSAASSSGPSVSLGGGGVTINPGRVVLQPRSF